jgi:hypothetical protein
VVHEIKMQLEANYSKQIENLTTTVASLEKANQRDLDGRRVSKKRSLVMSRR